MPSLPVREDPAPPLLESLLDRLQNQEDLEIEVKRARGGLPGDLWPTISAFANTQGGWIILGVAEQNGGFSVEGVANPPGLLQTLHSLLRNPQKVSFPVCGANDATIETADEGRQVIVLRVPAAPRKLRPVYVNGNPYAGTYVRRHAGDYLCHKPEVDRMMREAADVAADSAVLKHFTLDDVDREALGRYRRRFQTSNPALAWNGYDDRRFLEAMGGFGRDRERGEAGMTVAGVLLVGLPEAIRAWRELGFQLPAVESGTERYEFTLKLRHAHLLDDEDRDWLRRLGGTWSEAEQLALVYARREGEVENGTLRRLTGQHPADATKVLVGLRDPGFLQKLGAKRGARYQLGAALAAQAETALGIGTRNAQGWAPSPGHKEPSSRHSEAADDVSGALQELARAAREHPRLGPEALGRIIVQLCARSPLSLDELARLLNRHEDHLRRVLRGLLASERLTYLYPEQPSHPKQRYVAEQPSAAPEIP